MAATAIDSLRGILNGFRDLNSKGIYTMNATETDLLRQILIEVQALSLGGGLADGSVTTSKIADLNVTTPKLADNSVTTAKILDANVTPAKLSQPYTQGSPFTLSGVSYDVIGIPSWASEIDIDLSAVGFNASSTILFQIGDSGGISASGYLGGYEVFSASPARGNQTDGLLVYSTFSSGLRFNANLKLKRNGTTNTWVVSSQGYFESNAIGQMSVAVKILTNALDRIRITSVAGTATFNSGVGSISWQ
jgi:hypothetical protein